MGLIAPRAEFVHLVCSLKKKDLQSAVGLSGTVLDAG